MRAVVVGAGPAGLSAAIGLLRAGFETMLLERASEVKSRVCGSFLNPEAVGHLDWLGVREAVESAGVPVKVCRLTTPFLSPVDVPVRQRGRDGLGVPRVLLEEVLAEKFIHEGGRFEKGMNVTSVRRKGAEWVFDCSSRVISADWGVLSDGRFSVAHDDQKQDAAGWYGWNAAFSGTDQPPGALSLHFYGGGYVGTLTFKDGITNVCGLIYRERSGATSWQNVFEKAIENQPRLRSLLARARRETPWRGVGPLPHTSSMRRSDFTNCGDAAAVGDPFMGEGIGRALGAGPMLADAVAVGGGLSRFEADAAKKIYESSWKKYYTRRLQLGMLTRAVIRRRWLFRPAAAMLMNFKVPLVYTRFSHAGFQS